MLETNKVILFDTCHAYIVNGTSWSGGVYLFSPSVTGVACSHLAPLFLLCFMSDGGRGTRCRVNKTSHATIIIKQKIKQSFSTITLCLISLVENVSSLLPHLLQVQRLRIRVIGLAPTLNPDGLYK